MSPLVEVSHAVRARRRDMGLTQAAVAKLSGLSRATVNQLEAGTIRDLSLGRASRLLDALGLSIQVSSDRLSRGAQGRAKSPPLELAARTASVSYRYGMTAVELRKALLTGRFPDAILAPCRNDVGRGAIELAGQGRGTAPCRGRPRASGHVEDPP